MLKNQGQLTLFDDATITGTISAIQTGCPCNTANPYALACVISVANDITISGTGGVIEGACGTGCATSIEIIGGVLTLEDITVKGAVLMSSELVNNATLLVDDADHTMTLDFKDKSGSGLFEVTAGKLQIDATLLSTGSVLLDGADAEIEINELTCFSGTNDKEFTSGLLDVNDQLGVSGNWVLGGENSLPFDDLTIEVDSAASAEFGPDTICN